MKGSHTFAGHIFNAHSVLGESGCGLAILAFISMMCSTCIITKTFVLLFYCTGGILLKHKFCNRNFGSCFNCLSLWRNKWREYHGVTWFGLESCFLLFFAWLDKLIGKCLNLERVRKRILLYAVRINFMFDKMDSMCARILLLYNMFKGISSECGHLVANRMFNYEGCIRNAKILIFFIFQISQNKKEQPHQFVWHLRLCSQRNAKRLGAICVSC